MFLRSLLFFLFIVINTSDAFAKKSIEDLEVQALDYIEAINAKDFEKAALQIYYPESLQGEEKENEIREISKSLTIFDNEFGSVSNISPAELEKYYSALVMAGSLKFWVDKVNGLNLKYQVIYSKHNKGFMVFNFSEVNGELELRSVEYGLPATRSDAISVVTKLLGELANQ